MYKKPQSSETHFLRYEVRQTFLSFWDIFSPVTSPSAPPLTTQKTKILKKNSKHWKKDLETSSFYTLVPKVMIKITVSEIWHVLDVIIIFHFGQFLILSSRVRNIEKGPCRESKIMTIFGEKLQSYKFNTSFYYIKCVALSCHSNHM